MIGLESLQNLRYLQCRRCQRWFFLRASDPAPESLLCGDCAAPIPCDWCNGSGEGWDWVTWKVTPGGCTRCGGSGVKGRA